MRVVVVDVGAIAANRGLVMQEPNVCVRDYVVAEAGSGSDVHYVTRRPGIMGRVTRLWLEANHFPGAGNKLHDKSPGTVAELCKGASSCIFVGSGKTADGVLSTVRGIKVVNPRDCTARPKCSK